MVEAMSALGGGSFVSPYGVSIQRVLHALRTNAENSKPRIELPTRLTVQPDDPNHAQWRAEIAAYQKLAHARFKVKTKKKANMKA